MSAAIVLGLVGIVLITVCSVFALALCAAAALGDRQLEEARRLSDDERRAQATLYPDRPR
jgi:type II secretory pathway component PulK